MKSCKEALAECRENINTLAPQFANEYIKMFEEKLEKEIKLGNTNINIEVPFTNGIEKAATEIFVEILEEKGYIVIKKGSTYSGLNLKLTFQLLIQIVHT